MLEQTDYLSNIYWQTELLHPLPQSKLLPTWACTKKPFTIVNYIVVYTNSVFVL